LSVAHSAFHRYSFAKDGAPARIAPHPSRPSAEDAIASEDDLRSALSQHLKRLWRYAIVLSRQRDVADDLVQATCVRALERADQYSVGTRLDRWLFSILHSIWLNEVRARRVRAGQGFVDASEALVFDGVGRMEAQLAVSDTLKRVQALPDAQRSAVFLAYVEGLSYKEVADILEVPVGTVMSRLSAARLKLSEGMEPLEGALRRKDSQA
jgi:RNA polymerase sigma-70 factor, ECF subfamily